MNNKFIRTDMLFEKGSSEKLKSKKVAVFGAGGVGGYCIEALVRSGVGTIEVIDNDKVSESNINRQIIATEKTIGMKKTEAIKRRAEEINSEVNIIPRDLFYSPETEGLFDFSSYDYVVDAIDTVTGKISLAKNCYEKGVKIISSMGCGNKIHPEMFKVADIYKTSVCPLAKVMRRELKARGVKKLKVVYSEEEAITPCFQPESEVTAKKQTPASCAFVPGVAGLIIAGEVIKDLLEIEK
mgnify:FL=1